MSYWYLFAFCFGSYLIGSISFSIIISKFVLKSDVRKEGSGNPGATNMLRKFGFWWALLILILDMLKGIIPAVVGLVVYGDGYNPNPMAATTSVPGQIAMYACGLSAVLGHCFPIWTKFRGGKGVSTMVGVFTVANPAIGIGGLMLGMLLGIVLEYASVSSLMFITLAVIWEGFVKPTPPLAVAIMLAAAYFFVLFTHRTNILRLLRGEEKRAKLFKRKPKPIKNEVIKP